MSTDDLHDYHLETIAVHGGTADADPVFGSASPPIYQTSTFAFPSPEEGAARFAGTSPGFIYTRLGNPTIRALERTIADLEGGVSTTMRSQRSSARSCPSFSIAMYSCVPAKDDDTAW